MNWVEHHLCPRWCMGVSGSQLEPSGLSGDSRQCLENLHPQKRVMVVTIDIQGGCWTFWHTEGSPSWFNRKLWLKVVIVPTVGKSVQHYSGDILWNIQARLPPAMAAPRSLSSSQQYHCWVALMDSCWVSRIKSHPCCLPRRRHSFWFQDNRPVLLSWRCSTTQRLELLSETQKNFWLQTACVCFSLYNFKENCADISKLSPFLARGFLNMEQLC